MSQLIVETFEKACMLVIQTFISPLDSILGSIFGDNLSTLTTSLQTIINNIVSWCVFPMSFLPKTFLTDLKFILGLEILYITASISFYWLKWVFRVVRQIKFW